MPETVEPMGRNIIEISSMGLPMKNSRIGHGEPYKLCKSFMESGEQMRSFHFDSKQEAGRVCRLFRNYRRNFPGMLERMRVCKMGDVVTLINVEAFDAGE